MKRCINRFMLCWLLTILFASCIYDDYSDCPQESDRKMVRVNVDWHLFDKEVPTGMTVMVFPWSGGAPHTVLTNEITHADFSLEPGRYRILVFNQSTTEFGTLDFLGMDSYETARAVVQHTTSRWYSRGGDELIGVEPEWLASDKLDEFDVSDDFSEVTLTPKNVLSQIQVSVKVPGIKNLRYVRGSLTGISEGFLLGQGKPLLSKVTYLLESWTKTVDENDATLGTLKASVKCFGLPETASPDAENNQLSLSALLIDNKTQVDHQFAVGDKFKKDENSSELGYTVSLHVDVKVPQPLPEVKPSDGSSGGFDITIQDWGKPEDIDIEL
ncbi:DUF5119 domain-containing protein [Segatella sp.]|uniref:DUF5119 domain-containing protein n=1 Tax=Segatella sp. TaxID=2974253 RepID=UPI00307A9C89